MRIGWKLRMAAAQREVWTGVQLQRLLAEKAGLELSSASVSALLTKQPGPGCSGRHGSLSSGVSGTRRASGDCVAAE